MKKRLSSGTGSLRLNAQTVRVILLYHTVRTSEE